MSRSRSTRFKTCTRLLLNFESKKNHQPVWKDAPRHLGTSWSILTKIFRTACRLAAPMWSAICWRGSLRLDLSKQVQESCQQVVEAMGCVSHRTISQSRCDWRMEHSHLGGEDGQHNNGSSLPRVGQTRNGVRACGRPDLNSLRVEQRSQRL